MKTVTDYKLNLDKKKVFYPKNGDENKIYPNKTRLMA